MDKKYIAITKNNSSHSALGTFPEIEEWAKKHMNQQPINVFMIVGTFSRAENPVVFAAVSPELHPANETKPVPVEEIMSDFNHEGNLAAADHERAETSRNVDRLNAMRIRETIDS